MAAAVVPLVVLVVVLVVVPVVVLVVTVWVAALVPCPLFARPVVCEATAVRLDWHWVANRERVSEVARVVSDVGLGSLPTVQGGRTASSATHACTSVCTNNVTQHYRTPAQCGYAP